MDIKDVFDTIGGLGRAQMKIICLLNTIHIITGLHVLLYTVIGDDPGWSCPQPGAGGEKTTSLSSCALVNNGTCTPEFAKDFTSIVTEWNLICSKSNLPKLSQSAFFFGCLLGSWLWGKLADKMGRRKVFFLSLGCVLLSGLGYGLALDYYTFLFFRVCIAFGTIGTVVSSFVLSVELVNASSRSFAGMIGSLLFSVAYPLVAVMAYFVRLWRVLVLLATAMGASMFALWKIVPESPRWLVVNGREEEARQVLADIAQGNGTVMPKGELKIPTSDGGVELGTISLIRGPVIRRRTLTVGAIWFTECMVYYGLAMRVSDLGSNRYISLSLSGLAELPAYIITYKLLNRIGRRWIQSACLVTAGVACLLWVFFYEIGNESLGAPVALLGKFAVSSSFAVAYLYTTELFPTEVRNIALGVASASARVGGILAPIVLMTAQLHTSIPMLVMGSLAFGTGMLSFCLPETLNQPLPDTLKELDC